MSFEIEKSELDEDLKSLIKEKCNIWIEETQYSPPKLLPTYKVLNKKNVILPLGIWSDIYEEFPNKYKEYSKLRELKFVGTPQENEKKDQQTVLNEAISELNLHHFVFLSLRTGFGKTFSALYLIHKLGLKAVFLCHLSKIHTQFIEEANIFCPDMKIQIVKDDKLDPTYDVYVMGILKASNFDREEFSKIGCVIVDEIHLILTKNLVNALLNFSPMYLIGLSATPQKRDGQHKIIIPFFGEVENFIYRKEVKDFTIIKYLTPFKPIIKQSKAGSLDWSNIIRTISSNLERQKFIIELCKQYNDKRILILCERVCTILGCKNYKKCECKNKKDDIESYGLVPLLTDQKDDFNNDFDYCAYTKKTLDETKRIAIGTFRKLGTGYNSDRNLLIIESDLINPAQQEGRIRCDKNIVIDFVDNFHVFKKHWGERESWYIKRGATIVEKYYQQNTNNNLQNTNNNLQNTNNELKEHRRLI